MANSIVQITGLVLCIISAVCTVLAVILPFWRKNDPSNEVLEAIVRHQGIWISCISYPTGMWQCDAYDAFILGLPVQLQVARGLSVTSLAAIIFGLFFSMVGMECTKCVDRAHRTKSRVALVAGGCWLFSALCIGVAVSYYAHQVAQAYNFAPVAGSSLSALGNNQVQRDVFGNSLFLGWGAMALGMVGGAVMMCGSCYVESDDDEYWNKGAVGKGVRRVRNSFRESFRAIRPRKYLSEDRDYV